MGIVISFLIKPSCFFASLHLYSISIFPLADDISLLLDLSVLSLDELLGTIIHKLPLTDVLGTLASGPDLILEASLLSVLVREGAVGVETRVEFALGLNMCKLAVRVCAAGTVPAERHRGVLERALRVLAIGKEFAVLLALVSKTGRR